MPVEITGGQPKLYGYDQKAGVGIGTSALGPTGVWNPLTGQRHDYTYIAVSLLGDLPITDLPLRDVEFSWARNKPGTFSANLQVPVFPRSRDYMYATQPGRNGIYVFRDGLPIWGGIIWKRSMSSDARVVKLEGDTFDSYMYHRILDQDLYFERVMNANPPVVGTDQIDMFRILWAHMVGHWNETGDVMQNIPVPTRRNCDIQMVLAPSPNQTILRGRNFMRWDFRTYGEHMETLAGLKNGFEWYSTVVPAPEGSHSVSGVERRIEFGFPSLGRSFIETGFVWEYPANMLSYTWSGDADKSATAAYVLGAGEGVSRVYTVQYNEQRLDEGWPLLDVSYTHSTVSAQTTLISHASKYLRAFDPPVGEFSLTIHPDLPPTFSPMSGESYFLGDEIGIKIDDDIFDQSDIRNEDLIMVIEGIVVRPNDDGLEDVKPEVSIKARNTYIGPEEEDGSDQAGEVENTLPVDVGESDGSALVKTWGKLVDLRSNGGGWGGSRP